MPPQTKTSLALFDFDGTVTTKDSFVDFMKFTEGLWGFYWGFLVMGPWAALYFLKLLPGWKMKERALARFYRGETTEDMAELGRRYAAERLPRLIRPQALDRIRWHIENGHRVVMVSASLEAWLAPWCEKQNLELIATKLEEHDGRLTGKILGKSCVGEEKARHARETYDLGAYETVYAYGDTKDDLPMLALAQKKYFNWKQLT